MHLISGVKELFKASVILLNQPIVKERVKNIAGSVTFLFGLVEIYDIFQMAFVSKITVKEQSTSPKWVQVANKVVIAFAKLSLILSAGVSRLGVLFISSLVGRVFSTAQLDQVFGPNTIFAINPWRHPRHVVSIFALIFALPSVVQSTCTGIHWMYSKIVLCPIMLKDKRKANNWITDSKIRLMALFNTITSRPVLHIGNQLCQFVLRPL